MLPDIDAEDWSQAILDRCFNCWPMQVFTVRQSHSVLHTNFELKKILCLSLPSTGIIVQE